MTDPINESAGGPVRWALDLIEGFLPAFTAPWVAAVVRYPAQAAIVLIGLLASLGFSRSLEGEHPPFRARRVERADAGPTPC